MVKENENESKEGERHKQQQQKCDVAKENENESKEGERHKQQKQKFDVAKEKKTKTKEKDVSGTTKRERQNTCGHELTSWTFFFLCVLTISQTFTPQSKYNRREF